MREGIRVREITNDEGRRLLQIVRRSSGSVPVTSGFLSHPGSCHISLGCPVLEG